MGRRKRLGKLHISEIFSNFVGRIGPLEWPQVESKIVCAMMIFSFFFVLFVTSQRTKQTERTDTIVIHDDVGIRQNPFYAFLFTQHIRLQR